MSMSYTFNLPRRWFPAWPLRILLFVGWPGMALFLWCSVLCAEIRYEGEETP